MSECSTERGMIMKRFICALLILCLLLLAFASADSPEIVYLVYNNIAETFERGALLPEEYESSTDEDGVTMWKYTVSDGLSLVLYSYQDEVYQIGIICISSEPSSDFLPACYNSVNTLMNDYNTKAMNAVDAKIKLLAMGENPEISYVDGFYIHMDKKPIGTFFFITNAELFRGVP